MELKELIIQVLRSWQVWAAAAVIVLYVFLVRYVSRLYRRNRPIPMPKPGKKNKTPEAASGAPAPEPDDDLNLEEKPAENTR
jgi:flagellar biosynthesis/type III secretory pathway M-ring protein FliF/YscJ